MGLSAVWRHPVPGSGYKIMGLGPERIAHRSIGEGGKSKGLLIVEYTERSRSVLNMVYWYGICILAAENKYHAA